MQNAEDLRMPNFGTGRIPGCLDGILQLPQIWRIGALGIALGTMLSGCAGMKNWLSPKDAASTPPPVAQLPAAQPPAPPAPKPRRPVRETHETKEPEKIASIDPDNLIGLDPPGVQRLLGAPSNISKGDPSLVWTYNGQSCSFQIVFYPDIKTAAFHALKYNGGGSNNDQAENIQACIRTILMAKNNGPG
jgi:hypothetical protein